MIARHDDPLEETCEHAESRDGGDVDLVTRRSAVESGGNPSGVQFAKNSFDAGGSKLTSLLSFLEIN